MGKNPGSPPLALLVVPCWCGSSCSPCQDRTKRTCSIRTALLRGFANPSLLAVMALLVMGQAMVQTGALTGLTRMFLRLSGRHRGWH